MFDVNQFLDMQVTDANSTVTIPVPVGDYVAVISDVKPRQWQSKDNTSSGLALDVTWDIDSQEVKTLLGRDKVTVKQGLMLDLTESGGLDMGKGRNVGLGRLREATDLNKPGVAFSFNQLKGRVAKVNVSHRIDGENIYAEVKSVARM